MTTDPVLRVIRGTPTPAELAALVGVLLGRAHRGAGGAPEAPSAWARSARPGALLPSGLPPRPENGAWRRATSPR